eukprot:7325841-Heterocapsa_arctica.AAC.1
MHEFLDIAAPPALPWMLGQTPVDAFSDLPRLILVNPWTSPPERRHDIYRKSASQTRVAKVT